MNEPGDRTLEIYIVFDGLTFRAEVNREIMILIHRDSIKSMASEFGVDHLTELVLTAITPRIMNAIHEVLEKAAEEEQP